jgi:Tol biopolymer transport system component
VVIHSVEEADGASFLTMELVAGKTLADFITKDGLPLERFFQIAIPLADAIRAAHQRGITHRDLKPANIIVSDEDGRPKVLDFGLAKLKEEIRGTVGASTISGSEVTAAGRILGTVSYMSPEQAEGKAVDHRSDIFSLGIILYEMATGARPFQGDSNMSVLSSIIKDTPKSITELNPRVPRELARVIRRCLEKDPERRLDSAKDLRNDLEDIKRELDSGELRLAARAATDTHGRGRRPWLLVAAGVALIVVATAVFWWWIGRRSPAGGAPPAVNFVQLTSLRGVEAFPSLSPDGKWLAYTGDAAGNWDIYLQSISGQNPINLTKDSPAADYQPAFSPDGQSIAFVSDREGGGIFVMGLTGENVRRISDVGFNPAWSPDGRELAYATVAATLDPYSRQGVSELWVVKVATGEKRRVVTVDVMQPQWSPHGKRIAFWGLPVGSSRRDIWTVAAAGGTPVPVTSDEALDWSPVWSPDGGWLYFASDRGGALNLWRIAIDEDTGAVRGTPQGVPAPSKWVGHLTFSLDGSKLAFCSFTGSSNIQRFRLDPKSATIRDSGQWVTSSSRSQFTGPMFVDVSPDGRSLVFDAGQPQEDLFICDADGSHLRALTDDPAWDRGPRWSPDGRQVGFYSDRSGQWESWIINRDGSGLKPLGAPYHMPIWSPDGSRMTAVDFREGITFILDGHKSWAEQSPEVLRGPASDRESALATRLTDLLGSVPGPVPSASSFMATSWSPDGNSVAGYTGEGIAIYSLPSKQYHVLTRDGGTWPCAWLNDNRRILYLRQDRLALVDTDSRKVMEVLSVLPDTLGRFTISRDNQELYIVRASNEADIWLANLK